MSDNHEPYRSQSQGRAMRLTARDGRRHARSMRYGANLLREADVDLQRHQNNCCPTVSHRAIVNGDARR
jgi:hypothetical protein